jgi:hypothetical protein
LHTIKQEGVLAPFPRRSESEFDTLGVSAPTSACCKKSVLITKTAAFSELARRRRAVEVDPTVEGIARELTIFTDDAFDRAAMWREGNDYLTSTLPWERLVSQYLDLLRGVVCSR